MDNSGQLTFSDDPLLNGINEVYQLIENGEFSSAAEKIDSLMNMDPEYPGLIDCFRTAKFWNIRVKELKGLAQGKESAEFLMKQWDSFDEYAAEKEMKDSSSYGAVMRYVFFKAADHYKIAFKSELDTSDNFNLLLNLGDCFLRLEEYRSTIDTLEFAKNSYKSNARLLATLAVAYFHVDELPKCLLYFREAFISEPTEINLDLIKVKPINEIIDIINKVKGGVKDVREWIPVFGFIKDIFYVRRNISKHQVQSIEKEIYNLELNYHKMSREQLESTNVLPRLITKYLVLRDYYEFQNYSFDNLAQIRDRLLQIDKGLFQEYFNSKKI